MYIHPDSLVPVYFRTRLDILLSSKSSKLYYVIKHSPLIMSTCIKRVQSMWDIYTYLYCRCKQANETILHHMAQLPAIETIYKIFSTQYRSRRTSVHRRIQLGLQHEAKLIMMTPAMDHHKATIIEVIDLGNSKKNWSFKISKQDDFERPLISL